MKRPRKIPTKTKVLQIAKAALEKKALDIVILNVEELSSYADYFVITSGTSDRHVQAVADGIISAMRVKGKKPLGVEGMQKGHWVLLDFDDVIIHIFYRPIREFYGLERLWADAKKEEISDEPRITRPRAKKISK